MYNIYGAITVISDIIKNPISISAIILSSFLSIIITLNLKTTGRVLFCISLSVSMCFAAIGMIGCVYAGSNSLEYLGMLLFFAPFFLTLIIEAILYVAIKFTVKMFKNKK